MEITMFRLADGAGVEGPLPLRVDGVELPVHHRTGPILAHGVSLGLGQRSGVAAT